MMPGFVIYLVNVVKIIKGERTSFLITLVGFKLSSLYVDGSPRCSSIILLI